MDITEELSDATHRYLRGEIALAALADTSDRHVLALPSLAPSSLASRLIGAIEHGLAELDNGAITETDIKQDLQSELAPALAPAD